MDNAMLGVLGAGFLTAGVMPAFADGDIKTYSSFINFLTNDWKFNPFLQHGYNMWVAWFVLGSSQVASVRYLKGSWPNINMWVHRIGGSAMVVLTSYFGYKAIATVGKVINNEHSYFVFPIMLSVLLVAAFGATSNYDVNLSTNNQWNTKMKLDEKKMHTYPAYGTLAASLFAMSYGMHYYRISPKHYSDVPIEWYQVALTIFTVLAAEAYYQYSIKDERPFQIENTSKISVAQFKERVKNGEKLVLLDDLVLDMGNYITNHPGGRFSMEANIGRDVSKFFYGGYALENQGDLAVKPHTHSNDARKLVEKFAIGYLDKKTYVNQFNIQSAHPANGEGTTQTIVFNNKQGERRADDNATNNSLLNPTCIAKHYVVKSTALPQRANALELVKDGRLLSDTQVSKSGQYDANMSGIKRHYTEAFAMRPAVK